MILEGRPYGKDYMRTSGKPMRKFLGQEGGKARAIPENSRVATRVSAA